EARVASPTIRPLLLMARAREKLPPRKPSGSILYSRAKAGPTTVKAAPAIHASRGRNERARPRPNLLSATNPTTARRNAPIAKLSLLKMAPRLPCPLHELGQMQKPLPRTHILF